MGLLISKKKEALMLTKIARLAVVAFIGTLAYAIIDTIWAVYLNSYLNNTFYVGMLSAALTLVSFISYFIFIPLIEKINKEKIYITTLILYAISYILFAIHINFYVFVALSFFLTIIHTLRITSFGIMIKDHSPKSKLSRNEGVMYTFTNTAYLVGPLIAGLISQKYGIRIIFVLSAIFTILSGILFSISKIKDGKTKKRTDKNIYKNFREFFKDKDRTLSYVLSGGVNYWWALIYLFMPLMIIKELEIEWVGYFLFLIVLPIILVQYYFSELAGKIGFKKIFRIGFIIPCIFALICFFTPNIYAIMILLVIGSIGIGILEPTTEAYFFDLLKGKEDLRFYGPYNTTIEVNLFIAKIISSFVIFLLPFKFIFLLFSISMFIFFLISSRTKEIIEKKR